MLIWLKSDIQNIECVSAVTISLNRDDRASVCGGVTYRSRWAASRRRAADARSPRLHEGDQRQSQHDDHERAANADDGYAEEVRARCEPRGCQRDAEETQIDVMIRDGGDDLEIERQQPEVRRGGGDENQPR